MAAGRIQSGADAQPQYNTSMHTESGKSGRNVRIIETSSGDIRYIKVDSTFERKMREGLSKFTGEEVKYATHQQKITLLDRSMATGNYKRIQNLLAKDIAKGGGLGNWGNKSIHVRTQIKIIDTESHLLDKLQEKSSLVKKLLAQFDNSPEVKELTAREKIEKKLSMLKEYGVSLNSGEIKNSAQFIEKQAESISTNRKGIDQNELKEEIKQKLKKTLSAVTMNKLTSPLEPIKLSNKEGLESSIDALFSHSSYSTAKKYDDSPVIKNAQLLYNAVTETLTDALSEAPSKELPKAALENLQEIFNNPDAKESLQRAAQSHGVNASFTFTSGYLEYLKEPSDENFEKLIERVYPEGTAVIDPDQTVLLLPKDQYNKIQQLKNEPFRDPDDVKSLLKEIMEFRINSLSEAANAAKSTFEK